MPPRIDFVIPIFNESDNISLLVTKLNETANRIHNEFGLEVGYIVVDDGSDDGSFDKLCQVDFGIRTVRLRQLSRNFGKEAALSAGIEAAEGSAAAILIDADLQHPPELAIDLVRTWMSTNADSVYTYKSDRRHDEGYFKCLMSKVFFGIINLNSRFTICENAGDFRLINRNFIDALMQLPESERFMKGLYGWVGFKQVGIPFRPDARANGESNFRLISLLLITLDALTSFTVTPLRIIALSGLFVAIMSVSYGLFIVTERLLAGADSGGIASVLTLISFFGGIQMVFLGLLGEYVSKAVLEAKRRPAYIVSQDITLDSKKM